MTRIPVPFAVDDISTFAKTLRKQFEARDAPPSHVELLNMLARSVGHRNFQQLRARAKIEPTDPAPPSPEPQADLARVERVLRHFDGEGRLLRWPSRRSHQEFALWALWSRFPASVSLDDAAVKAFLATRHAFGDHALLRRELVDAGLVIRTADGRDYRRVERRPPPDALALIARIATRSEAVSAEHQPS
ncbi:DUF2087 domain-containing protein [Kaistia dalseonensis]|uniref:DUF2087 domain-containing protein n=1 Tax=Kaistia dalseonensis TaxID=410840 RepID=A0ABU0HDI8_9HYPH|nr:DUF2087 domain-containing protein [Kaistia dalseonensis]MCX5497748.1 DUF2087 domain-containing protein [Kaistia dalseonensis]MDQ0440392.1 hypothetical protein [Kaistia dalseonensis]